MSPQTPIILATRRQVQFLADALKRAEEMRVLQVTTCVSVAMAFAFDQGLQRPNHFGVRP